MMPTDPSAERFLAAIKQEQRSSPAGIHWHKFYQFLLSKKQPGQKDPPVPLILAASGESNRSKYVRLSSQLAWAVENGCIGDAIRYLEEISPGQWNSCPLERWEQNSY